MKKAIWDKTWFSWAWKIACGLTIASTVACTWWMKLNFATKEEIREMQNLVTKADFEKHREKYWSNRREDVKQVLDVEKRVDRLEQKRK